jgi:RES domain-containing protein
MNSPRQVRDNALIDAIEALPETEFDDIVWQIVRGDRDPLRGSAPGGRWDDGTFDVLYTSMASDGAVAELHYHLSRGQSVFPSKMQFRRFEIRVKLSRSLRLADMTALQGLGLDSARYGAMKYDEKQEEYPRTQEIAEIAHFLNFDGLVVPSARWDCRNVVIFTGRVPPEALSVEKDHGPIDWDEWKRNSGN